MNRLTVCGNIFAVLVCTVWLVVVVDTHIPTRKEPIDWKAQGYGLMSSSGAFFIDTMKGMPSPCGCCKDNTGWLYVAAFVFIAILSIGGLLAGIVMATMEPLYSLVDHNVMSVSIFYRADHNAAFFYLFLCLVALGVIVATVRTIKYLTSPYSH